MEKTFASDGVCDKLASSSWEPRRKFWCHPFCLRLTLRLAAPQIQVFVRPETRAAKTNCGIELGRPLKKNTSNHLWILVLEQLEASVLKFGDRKDPSGPRRCQRCLLKAFSNGRDLKERSVTMR